MPDDTVPMSHQPQNLQKRIMALHIALHGGGSLLMCIGMTKIMMWKKYKSQDRETSGLNHP
jgi:hypothetical protein